MPLMPTPQRVTMRTLERGRTRSWTTQDLAGLVGTEATCGNSALALPRESIQPHRGWSDDEWDDAERNLIDAGVLAGDGQLTVEGRALRQRVEDATDRLAGEPWKHLGSDRADRLRQLIGPVADTIADSATIPYPNPMALPHLRDRS